MTLAEDRLSRFQSDRWCSPALLTNTRGEHPKLTDRLNLCPAREQQQLRHFGHLLQHAERLQLVELRSSIRLTFSNPGSTSLPVTWRRVSLLKRHMYRSRHSPCVWPRGAMIALVDVFVALAATPWTDRQIRGFQARAPVKKAAPQPAERLTNCRESSKSCQARGPAARSAIE
jgi:hypothetical protein